MKMQGNDPEKLSRIMTHKSISQIKCKIEELHFKDQLHAEQEIMDCNAFNDLRTKEKCRQKP